jgi:hypothetical protein
MKLHLQLDTGLVGCSIKDSMEIDDEDLDGLDDDEKVKFLREYAEDWMWNQIELDYWEEGTR